MTNTELQQKLEVLENYLNGAISMSAPSTEIRWTLESIQESIHDFKLEFFRMIENENKKQP
jgi:hypothetical protein